MNNSSPFGATDFDLADRGRRAVENIRQQRETTQIRPILWRRAIGKIFTANRDPECLNCRRINFHRILDDGINDSAGVLHSTLFDAIQNRDCPFCQHVCHVAIEKFGHMGRRDQSQTTCTIHHEYGWIGHARIEKKELHTEPRVEIRVQHKCSKGSHCHPHGLSVTEKFLLERFETRPRPEPDPRPATLFRNSLDYKFDPKQLLNWLERSNNAASRDRKVPSSLDLLLREGRLRVVDAMSNEIVTLRSPARYVALSYVWGKGHHNNLSMHHATIEKRDSFTGTKQTSLDLKALPLTIRDALTLVKAINERYLWVDSLCILQDDAEDKATVISEMSAVYGNAYVTIIATDGSNANSRISRLAGKDTPEEPISFTSGGRPICLLPALPGMEDTLKPTRWSSRGWTLQERLLSKRCALFTRSGVFFESEAFSESEAYGIKPGAFDIPGNSDDYGQGIYNKFLHTTEWNLETYSYAVREYTAREFSHPGDRLDAFMGIMRQRSPQDLPLHHLKALNGLAINSFIQSLFWSPSGSDKLTRLSTDARQSRYLPSWSWVGWTGAVQIPTDWKPVHPSQINIVDAANIVCNNYDPPIKFPPRLCKVMKRLRVILHLIAETWPCTLKPSGGENASTYLVNAPILKRLSPKNNLPFDITPDVMVPEEDDYEDLKPKKTYPLHPDYEVVYPEIVVPDGIDINSNFELVALPNVPNHLLIVRHLPSFAERIGIIMDWEINWDAQRRRSQKYIRLG